MAWIANLLHTKQFPDPLGHTAKRLTFINSFFIYPLAPELHLLSFIKNNSQSYAQTKIKPFHCTKFVFRLVKEMQECTAVLFHRKKIKNNHKNVRKTCYWKLIFVICSYSTWRHKHARHAGTWAHKHARHVGTRARKHAKHVGTWARKASNLAGSIFCNKNHRLQKKTLYRKK